MNLRRWLSGVFRRDLSRQTPPRDDQDDGLGVLVPAGPRPLRGGAHAQPPKPQEDRRDLPRR
ncbi:hypothetical protein [Deinococcus humi]|uniref:Uncharacterized protein n=1 Tax=Deinococcus humi TaxID=662880 RepID=A0A7W8JYI2_9DEIO|nr:hypothetical protein [Deinococcus humi]MBB5365587.1 hypothetical protein [Deinococcus humi]